MSDLLCENFGAAVPPRVDRMQHLSVCGIDVDFGTASGTHGRDGSYATMLCGRLWELSDSGTDIVRALAEVIYSVAAPAADTPPQRILVAAFGNSKITSDSLGSEAADRIIPLDGLVTATGKRFPEVFVIKTGMKARSGISSADTVAIFSSHVRADMVICIDALCSGAFERLGTVVQVTDVGIAPGSGVSSHSSGVNSDKLGVPTIAVGVPTVIRGDSRELYTVAMAESLIAKGAAVIAGGINLYFTKYCMRSDL